MAQQVAQLGMPFVRHVHATLHHQGIAPGIAVGKQVAQAMQTCVCLGQSGLTLLVAALYIGLRRPQRLGMVL